MHNNFTDHFYISQSVLSILLCNVAAIDFTFRNLVSVSISAGFAKQLLQKNPHKFQKKRE